ncbi:MAG: ATP synthase F1 subunit delta [Candidatus Zixiibacteriota bacterium]
MIESQVARRYATALFRTAKRIDQVERILEDLKSISDLLRKDPNLKNFLEAPQILDQHKRELITTVFRHLVSEALFSFLVLVLEKHRIEYLLAMAKDYERLVKEDQGILQARIITAHALGSFFRNKLKEELEKSTGKKIEMILEIDPQIIGGMIVILGNKIIDRSIRHQLDELEEEMLALTVH